MHQVGQIPNLIMFNEHFERILLGISKNTIRHCKIIAFFIQNLRRRQKGSVVIDAC